ncbi:FxsA family protein [Verrucomicrobiales bacterium]|nr:FxsA family protein [Verrucomicrobiales bacterium]MDC0314476.1 FxsA family protein [bacterium]
MFPKLLILFIVVPLIELYLFMTIGAEIGIFPTVAIIVVTGALGAWLTRLQGLKTLRNFQKATSEGRMPHEEIMDGLMILVAGAVLLTPGFLTDAIGFSLLLPPVRAVVRKFLGGYLKSRIHIVGMPTADNPATAPRREDVVIEVESEVIDVDVEVVKDPQH